MDHQTKTAQKRVLPRKSHILSKLFSDYDETSVSINAGNIGIIICEAILKIASIS